MNQSDALARHIYLAPHWLPRSQIGRPLLRHQLSSHFQALRNIVRSRLSMCKKKSSHAAEHVKLNWILKLQHSFFKERSSRMCEANSNIPWSSRLARVPYKGHGCEEVGRSECDAKSGEGSAKMRRADIVEGALQTNNLEICVINLWSIPDEVAESHWWWRGSIHRFCSLKMPVSLLIFFNIVLFEWTTN